MLSAMDQSLTDLERAFQLARSGICTSVVDLKKRLKEEGRSLDQITGRTLTKQLDALIKGVGSTMSKGSYKSEAPADVIGNATKDDG